MRTIKVLWAISAAFLLSGMSKSALSQEAKPSQDPDEAKFTKKVHLLLGPTTLDKVAAALSEQTGLNIQAADYLQTHKLTVQLDNIPAQEALHAIRILNGWTVTKSDAGAYVVTHTPTQTAQTFADAGRALRSTLPKEFRIFFGLEAPIGAPNTFDPNTDHLGFASTVRQGAQEKLLESLKPNIGPTEFIPYDKLNPSQQEDLLCALVFGIFGSHVDDDLWADRRGFHRMDLKNTYLQIENKEILMISAQDDLGGFPGFGQNIFRGPGGLGAPPPPLR